MKHVPPKFLIHGIDEAEYRRQHPLSEEQIEENRLWLLKEFARAFYEFEMLEESRWTN